MSADNAIFVQQRGKRWYVWHDGVSQVFDGSPCLDNAKCFYTEKKAVNAAWEMAKTYAVLEYGIVSLPQVGCS